MEFQIEEVGGIGEYKMNDLFAKNGEKEGEIFLAPNDKAFIVDIYRSF